MSPEISESQTIGSPPGGARHSRLWWIVRGLEVRLRFFAMVGLAAAIVAGWPWLRGFWNRMSAHSQASSAVSADSEFFCPMDPGVRSAWPAICPICNMDLVPRKKTDAVMLPEGVVARMQFSPYRVQLAGVRTTPVERRRLVLEEESSSEETLVVPVSAVLHRGGEQLVYVESMPNMFDGVLVRIGDRQGGVYPVLEGLKAGQRVVSAGSFLVDAESRLNSNVATQYFGANGQAPRREPPAAPTRSSSPGQTKEPLAAEDLALVSRQRICPVTELPLGSMGRPVAVTVTGQKVFLCCRGCEKSFRADTEKFLARLKAPAAAAKDRSTP